MDTEQLVANHRTRLLGLAYRMLGEMAEAEDAVQETFLRWSRSDTAAVDNPAGWLTTALSRICVDRLRSAQRRREAYVGPWLPEPVDADAIDPGDSIAMADSLSLAFLVVLERLSPLERAAFLLHDVFGYRHDEVAAMLDRSPAAIRQVAARARSHIERARPRYDHDSDRHAAVVDAFVAAVSGADLDALMAVLAPDVTFVADGGGVVAASRHPQHGANRVAMVILSLARRAPADWSLSIQQVNGQRGLVVHTADGTPDSVWVLHARDGLVAAIDVLRNPAKLSGIAHAPRR